MLNNKVVKMMMLLLLVFNVMSVPAMSAEEGFPATANQGRTAYAEILNHSIRVAEEVLRMRGVPSTSEPWHLLNRTVDLVRRISEVESDEGEVIREYFLEGMNYVYSAVLLAVNTSSNNEQYMMSIEVRRGIQEIHILNETINNIKLRLSYLNRSASAQRLTINAFISVVTELTSRLNSLKKYLVELRSEGFNKTYVLGELNSIKEQVRTLNRELNNVQLNEVREKLKVRINERLRNFNDEVGKLSRAFEDIKKWGVPEVSEVIGTHIEEINAIINTSKHLLSLSENLSSLEYLRTASNIDSVFNSLNLSLKKLNNMLEELRRFRDLINREVVQIEEASTKLGQMLRSGRLPPNVSEQVAEVVEISSQVVSGSTNLLRNLVVNTTSANVSLHRFESVVRKGMMHSQELRKSLVPHQHSEIISLINNVERSLDNMLENVNALNRTIRQINDEERMYAEKLITMSMKVLNDLSLCRTDPITKELLNNTLTSLKSALISLKAEDLETTRNSLNSALDGLKELRSRLQYPHTLRIDSLIRYLHLTLSRLQLLG
ncbi:MAG: hypothetical protein QXT01_06220 [Sulfolobales archaeon]